MGAIQPSSEMMILFEVRQHAGGKQSTRRKYVADVLVDVHVCLAQLCLYSLLHRSVDVRKRVSQCTYIRVYNYCSLCTKVLVYSGCYLYSEIRGLFLVLVSGTKTDCFVSCAPTDFHPIR